MITSSYRSAAVQHTVEILTWRELAAEQLARMSAHVSAHIPEMQPRRITYVRRGTVAA